MRTKPKTKSGATAMISTRSDKVGTNAADGTDDVTSRARAAALAEVKEIIRNGGTQDEAVAAAKMAARMVLEKRKQELSRDGGEDSDIDHIGSVTVASANKNAAATVVQGRMGLPPRGPANVEGGGRVGIFGKLRNNKGRNEKETTKNGDKKAKAKTKTKTNDVTAAEGASKGRKVKNGKGRSVFQIKSNSPLRRSKEANGQQAAPDPPAESGDDDQHEPADEDEDKGEREAPLIESEFSASSGLVLNGNRSAPASRSIGQKGIGSSLAPTQDEGIVHSEQFFDRVMHAAEKVIFPIKSEKKAGMRTKSDSIEESKLKQNATCYPDIMSCFDGILGQEYLPFCALPDEHSYETSVLESTTAMSMDDSNTTVNYGYGMGQHSYVEAEKSVSWADLSVSQLINDPGVLDLSVSPANKDTRDPSSVWATARRLISGRRKGKKNTTSNADGSQDLSVQPRTIRPMSRKLKDKKNTSSKMNYDCMETISTKGTLPKRTGKSSLVTGTAINKRASSKTYFLPGGREADVAVFEGVDDSEILVQDASNGELDEGNEYKTKWTKTGANTVSLKDGYDPNWRDTVSDTAGTTARPVNTHAGQRRMQQQQRTHLPRLMHQHPGVAPRPSSGHSPPLSPSTLQNNHRGNMLSPAHDQYYQNSLGNTDEHHNPKYAPASAVLGGVQKHHHSNILVSGYPCFNINSNLSLESTDEERQDRYAGAEQQELDMRDDKTLVDSGPPHTTVSGMAIAGSAIGGYGIANMTNNRMIGQQGHQGMAGNGAMGCNAGDTIVNDYTGMMTEPSSSSNLTQDDCTLDLIMGKLGHTYNHAHHATQLGHQSQLHQQGYSHQPMQQLGTISSVQQSQAWAQAHANNNGGMQNYGTNVFGPTRAMQYEY